MKNIKIMWASCIFCLHFIPSTVKAQASINETARYKLVYRMIHHYDSTDPRKTFDEKMELLIGSKFSWFRSAAADQYAKDLAIQKQQRIMDAKSGNSRPVIPLKKPIGTQIFHNHSSNQVIVCEDLLTTTYLMQDTLPVIQWNLGQEKKLIGDLLCQKATGMVKGRIYEAWFYPGIPVQTGPWYIKGLPGLVVQATDQKGVVEFLYDSMTDLTGQQTIIHSPIKYVGITRKNWKKLLTAYQEDPIQFMINQNAQKGVSTTVTGLPPGARNRKNPVNNPMDLSSVE